MYNFKCYRCETEWYSFTEVVSHSMIHHEELCIKYRELELDESTGRYGYRTKVLPYLVPKTLKLQNKNITVRNGSLFVTNNNDDVTPKIRTPMETTRDSAVGKSKYPVKIGQASSDLNEDTDMNSPSDEEPVNIQEAYDEMQRLLPVVLSNLFEYGKLQSYLKFNRLVHEKKLPMNNICFLLFNDLVEWYASSNTSQMRYQKETVQFWQLGYRLFHGKFIRFMSGLRNYGKVLDDEARSGELTPDSSRINFAVPGRNNLYKKDDQAKPIYPGICEDNIKAVSKVFSGKPMKVCVDGKKISRGTGKKMGDIDCWGYESKPTLTEKRLENKKLVDGVAQTEGRIDKFLERGKNTLDNLILTDRETLSKDLLDDVKSLAEQNKLLREKAEYLERIENKLKTMGGKSWMTSRYYPAICSVRVSRSSIISQIEESLKLTNKLALYVATLNNRQTYFETSDTVLIEEQANYFKLNDKYETEECIHIRQRTDAWMRIREDAMVTGSTCNKALGLGKLKEQQSHYDQVVLKKDKPPISEDTEERMKYGTKHEEDAIATVCAKVIPSLFPDLTMYEEGCVTVAYEDFERFLVVSPDGSLKYNANSNTHISYENKCKSPTSYSPHAYYTIPNYYIPQLLCGMNACNCDKLLFTCWSEESMTVFEVQNDTALRQRCWNELTNVYASENRSRPKHFTQSRKQLQEHVKNFQNTHTKLIGEFPSAKIINTSKTASANVDRSNPYVVTGKRSREAKQIKLTVVQNTLEIVKKWFLDTYECLRSVASEILVFMVSDLDRVYDMEEDNSHIIAYAMKGPSMRNDVLRKMMHDVIAACENHGLSISVTSSDGQWHQYGVKYDKQEPLTVHQLQRKVWSELQSKDRQKLQATLRRNWLVKSLDDVRYEKQNGKVYVVGHERDRPICFRSYTTNQSNTDEDLGTETTEGNYPNAETTQETVELSEVDCDIEKEPNDLCYFGCITRNFDEMELPDTVDIIDRALAEGQFSSFHRDSVYSMSSNLLFEGNKPDITDLDMRELIEVPTQTSSVNEASGIQDDTSGSFLAQLLNEDDCGREPSGYMEVEETLTSYWFGEASRILHQRDSDCLDVNLHEENATRESDIRYLPGACVEMETSVVQQHSVNLDPSPTANENIQECLSIIQKIDTDTFTAMLHDLQHDKKCMEIHNWLETDIETFISYCSTKASMNKHLQKREVYICTKCIEMRCTDIGLNVISTFPKYRLLGLLFDRPEQQINVPIIPRKKRKLQIESLKDLAWNKVRYLNKYQLMKIIAENKWEEDFKKWKLNSPVPHGIKLTDISSEIQWFTQPRVDEDGKIRFHFTDSCHLLTCLRTKLCTTGIKGLQRKAWEIAALSKETKLNISVVVDYVDKQDVALARRVFAEDVEKVIQENKFEEEAIFCRLIRLWYDSEDEPAVPAYERNKRRLDLLNWLLDGYSIGEFPPPTRNVKGVPIVTYEAMICNLERKLQLYAFVPGSMYNVRACGTQEVEQLFSSFRDMDPSGSGTVKPDIIPRMLASATEIDNYRMQPNKPFYIKTSSASVYPSHSMDISESGETKERKSFIRTVDESLKVKEICPRDHHFDSEIRDRRSHNRASGVISLPRVPAHGEQGVRQFHRRDDSKIPAHRRLGFLDLPDV